MMKASTIRLPAFQGNWPQKLAYRLGASIREFVFDKIEHRK